MNTNDPVQVLDKLVAFDTVSSRSNLALIEWSANLLDGLGYRVDIQRTANGQHANLYASIGAIDEPGVILSGHSDVVPVEGQDWHSDPFKLTEKGSKLHARGSADMKGFIACVLAKASDFAAGDLRQPIHIALSHSEETNMSGMQEISAKLAESGPVPAACIIGEPTSMQVVIANKGAAIFRARVRGFAVHSSLRDQGISAVEIAAEMISYLNRMQKQLLTAEPNDGFEFPHTSIHAGVIHGGTAHNITAQDCEFKFEIRALPGVDANQILAKLKKFCDQELLPQMLKVSEDCAIDIDEIVNSPGLSENSNKNLAQAIMPLCNCLTPGRVSFGTEAGFLTRVGVPTVVCGPGEIRVAHQPDEYVSREQLNLCAAFLDTLNGRLRESTLL